MAFILLAERGYFKGRRWTDFSPVVRQLGDSPPVFSVPREFSPKLLFDKGGLLCASNTSEGNDARAKPNRIFLTVKEQDRWNLKYVVFGTIETGLPVAQSLSDGETMSEITIEGDTAALRKRYAKDIAEWTKAIDALPAPRTP
jgi:peptidyl-prolyl cis-trans isomerase B (cyclophilin B)